MTDTATTGASEIDGPEEHEPTGTPPPTDGLTCPECAGAGKTVTLPSKAGLSSHRAQKHGWRREKSPPSVRIQVGPTGARPRGRPPGRPKQGTDEAELERLEERAKQALEFAAIGLVIMGQPNDATVLSRVSGEFGAAVRDVGRYEEWLRKAAAGGESSDRAMAWGKLIFVIVGGILMPLAINHNAVPPALAQIFGQVETAIPGAGAVAPPPGNDGAPVPGTVAA